MTEDISTIGWDMESSHASVSGTLAEDDNASAAMGDADADDLEADKRRYYEEHAMVVDGLRCPDEFIENITPMEFEEMVHLFKKFDADGSNTIDKHEIKRILHYLGLEFTIEKAEELLNIVDADKSGEIEFEEFCKFVVMIKKGDERVGKFNSLIDKLNATPLGELERQATTRGLSLKFVVSEVRPASLTNPTIYVLEVQLTGMWHRIENGEVVSSYSTRKFQGFGQNTREAKYNAAQNAIINLGDAMPGVKYPPGVIPDDWLQWVDENLLRGIDAGKVVSILNSKGFHAYKNTRLMHRILTWHSLCKFSEEHPDIDLTDSSVELDDDFVDFLRGLALKGIDGSVITELLEDRYIDLKREHLMFAQKLQNNEVGTLMGPQGGPAQILDFWHCCRHGFVDFVELYCKCGIPVNEEVLDRHTCDRVRAIWYAGYGGSADVIRILAKYGADVNVVDRRGRNAIHVAAIRGHKDACAALIDNGGKLFHRDLQGNTPLHLAALCNHYEVVDYLAFRGQDLTRQVYSDKVRPKQGITFDEVVAEIFEKMPLVKLSQAETVRFEKIWLHEAALMFLKVMDKNVRYMMPMSCTEIMDDVLTRFDPRPETGVFVTVELNTDQVFIRTIPTPTELAVLLRYVFRQAAVDMINRWHRTALHLACDANKIKSHERVILLLIDTYGCNVNLRDMHRRRAVELLIQDKIIRDKPSATQAREELLLQRREDNLNAFFKRIAEEDRLKTVARRRAILDECMAREDMMDKRLWNCLREAAIFKKRYNFEWEMYEDPDTGNYFFCKLPQKKFMQGNVVEGYSWTIPRIAKPWVDRTNALTYLRKVKSQLLRVYGYWEVYRCKRSGIDFYYHTLTEELTFYPPAEMQWRAILRESTKQPEILGYAQDWLVYKDKYGNTFYRNRISRYCEYDRSPDAKEMKASEKLCTSYQYKNQPLRQKWYTCEQCNRGWKMAMAERTMQMASGDEQQTTNTGNKTLLICEPCVARCHSNHKGVKYMYTVLSSRTVYCMCMEVGKMIRGQCLACVISDEQTKTQRLAEQFKLELRRRRQRDYDYPPIFACIPRYTRGNKNKVLSGWHLCRVCKPVVVNREGEEEEVEHELDNDTTTAGDSDDGSATLTDEEEDDNDDESELTGSETESLDGIPPSDNKQATLEVKDDAADESSQITKQSGSQVTSSLKKGGTTVPAANGAASVKTVTFKEPSTAVDESASKVLVPSTNGKEGGGETETGISDGMSVASSLEKLLSGKEVHRRKNLEKKRKKYPKLKFDNENQIRLIPEDGWVECYDIEEPEDLKFDDVVLCERQGGILKLPAKVKAKVIKGFFRVRYEDRQFGEEVLHRSKIELVSRGKFWFNIHTGQSSWSREAVDKFKLGLIDSGPIENGEGESKGEFQSESVMFIKPSHAPEIFESESLTLNGGDWMELYQQSNMRRGFDYFDEMYHEETDLVFYVHHNQFIEEKACLSLQRLYRQKHLKKSPFLSFVSVAFTFDIPPYVWKMKKELGGWGYLRRRSKNVGDFRDNDGNEWEEYMDNKTSEFFYWQEEDNQYRWEKPPLYKKTAKDFIKKEYEFKEGEECMFLFPGHRKEEVAIIKKVRYDDETNEPMYDIQHKYNESLIYKWIARVRVKQVPLEGEELKFVKLENKWRSTIKRRREIEERNKRREKELKLQEEMRLLEMLGSKAYQLAQQRQEQQQMALENGQAPPESVVGSQALVPVADGSVVPTGDVSQAAGSGGAVSVVNVNSVGEGSATAMRPIVISDTTRLMRGRMQRISLEAQILREELDEAEGKKRRERVREELENFKTQVSSDGRPLTRAAILSLTRSLEMKLILEDKVEKRNELQKQLEAKKQETQRRIKELDDYLRENEVAVTTPRSLYRRQIVRRAHIAMKRQSDGYIICEWGCGDWFRVGVEQQDHQLRRCVKRILPCILGCPLKHTEEHWLSPHESTKAYEKLHSNKKQMVQSIRKKLEAKKAAKAAKEEEEERERLKKLNMSSSLLEKMSQKISKGSAKSRKGIVNKGPDVGILEGDGESESAGISTLEEELLMAENMVDGEGIDALLMEEASVTMEELQMQEQAVVGEMTVQQFHETMECPKRLIMCPLQCLEWVCAENLDRHMKDLCTKRPADPIFCRLGCGMQFGGRIENLLEAEDERIEHENEECIYRIVRCNWVYDDGKLCAAQMKATERDAHRDYHMTHVGIFTYGVPGIYTYKTDRKSARFKIQLWGAGGGSGYFYGRQGGDGGGGAFVEVIIDIEPYSVLELTVGAGGGAGVRGKEAAPVDINNLRQVAAKRREKERSLPRSKLKVTLNDLMAHATEEEQNIIYQDAVETERCSNTPGGMPGGGEGYAGNECWASGGGGGYTAISKKTSRGTQLLLLAAGGGGGGSVPGLPGGGLDGILPGTLVDPLNGRTATVDSPGAAGESGSTFNSQWAATPGQMWQGGNGCEFGAGGGGGYYGGGGGGTSPGIGGGGGGGSSYVYSHICRDIVLIPGHNKNPGGMNHKPPQACGVGDWDKTGGIVGEGGRGEPFATNPGKNGGIRIYKTGFY